MSEVSKEELLNFGIEVRGKLDGLQSQIDELRKITLKSLEILILHAKATLDQQDCVLENSMENHISEENGDDVTKMVDAFTSTCVIRTEYNDLLKKIQNLNDKI